MTTKLYPVNGNLIPGVKINEHCFAGKVQQAQLLQLTPNPRDLEKRSKTSDSQGLNEAAVLRKGIQRHFAGVKARNVPDYADYIVSVHRGEDGLAPPIILYSEQLLETEETPEGTAFLQVPWGVQLLAIDGETQLAARFEAVKNLGSMKQEFVPVLICSGKPPSWARQVFHDLNSKGHRVNAALALAMDNRDPLTAICRAIEQEVPFFKGRVDEQRRQVGKTGDAVVTITSLRGACATLAKGIPGIQYGTKEVPMMAGEIEAARAAALDWFKAVTDAIGPAMTDRVSKLASSPSVLVAIGALGHPLMSIPDPSVRAAEATKLAANLKLVNWERDKQWEGIAGKFTPKGVFAVGGAKETGYAIYSALNEPSDPGYNRIRSTVSGIAA